MIAKNSEYIRLNYNETQEVGTNLDFKSEVLCNDAQNNNNPITLAQAENMRDSIYNDIVTNIPSAKPITSAKLFLSQVGNTFLGTSNYGGIGNIVFVTQDLQPLFLVAYSWTSAGNNQYPAYGVWNVWVAKAPQVLLPYQSRVIADPENLTQEDLDYLAQYGNTMRITGWLSSAYSSNLPDWSSVAYLFKGIYGKSQSNSSNSNIGCIWNSPTSGQVSLELDTTSPLFQEIIGVEIMVVSLGSAFKYQYGSNNWFIEWKINEKSAISHFLQYTKEEVITAKKPYLYMPLFRNEAYNGCFFEDVNNIYSEKGNACFAKLDYDSATDDFTLVRL